MSTQVDSSAKFALANDITSFTLQFTAYLGDLKFKHDTAVALQNCSDKLALFTTNSFQARWIEIHRLDSVPLPVGGNQPSDHTKGTIFEYYYETDPQFRGEWFSFLCSTRTNKCSCAFVNNYNIKEHEWLHSVVDEFLAGSKVLRVVMLEFTEFKKEKFT